jgi:integrase/recombinase XerD
MMPELVSGFAGLLRAFVDQKRALGHPYTGSIDILRQFDAMCSLQFPGRADLSQDICLAWAVKRPTEGRNALRNRTAAVREFARYLTRLGESAYLLPPALTRKGPRHVPHIYTPAEIAAIWQAADDTPPLPGYPIRHLVIPAILRLIYCCGLRPVEARTLPVNAVDLDRGRIDIAESKGHTSRQVWMADDLTAYCRAFHAHACRLLPERSVFFSDSHGNAYTKVWLDTTFRTVRARAGITPCRGTATEALRPAPLHGHPPALPVGPAGQRPRRDAAVPVGLHGPRPAIRHLLLHPPRARHGPADGRRVQRIAAGGRLS